MSEPLSVCIAGATGWTGPALVRGVLDAPDLSLRSAVSRSAAGRDLGEALGGDASASRSSAAWPRRSTASTSSSTTRRRRRSRRTSWRRSTPAWRVVIGSSGLTADDFAEIDAAARERSVGVVASGNFSLTAAMCQAGALLAARHLPQWEVIDYASATKPDVPSGTARELAERLGEVRRPGSATRSRTSTAPGRRAAPPSAARRSTPCAFRASSCRPRWSSACPTSA